MSNIGTAAIGKALLGSGAGASPTFSTATYPFTAGTSGNVLTSDGTNWTSAPPATSGTVTSVSGTANRITSTGGNTPVIDIAANYVGQTSITTLGTIITGIWNGTVIDLAHGGTNANLTASNGGIFYSTATSGAILSGTATAGQIIRSGASTSPTWSTATYPDTAGTSGNVLTSDGTNWISSPAPGAGMLFATLTLTSAQIKSLNATPISIVAAPGAGKVIVPIFTSMAKFNYGGSNVFVAGASQVIGLYWSTLQVVLTSVITNATLTGTVSRYTLINPGGINGITPSNIENQPLTLYNAVATEISGNAANNNTVDISIFYYIVTL